jgi:hypothetical protein
MVILGIEPGRCLTEAIFGGIDIKGIATTKSGLALTLTIDMVHSKGAKIVTGVLITWHSRTSAKECSHGSLCMGLIEVTDMTTDARGETTTMASRGHERSIQLCHLPRTDHHEPRGMLMLNLGALKGRGEPTPQEAVCYMELHLLPLPWYVPKKSILTSTELCKK